jgi:hypothetical protein
MFSAIRGLRRPAKTFVASIGLLVAELILIGLPGPCGMPGVLDRLFIGHRGAEDWTAYVIVMVAISGIVLSAGWWCASFFVQWMRRETDG